MDNIWRKAGKKLRNSEREILSAQPLTLTVTLTVTTPAPATSPSKTSNATLLNTVASCDTRLLQMEQEWAQTRSGPFPNGIRNAIVNLRAALVIREAEAEEAIARAQNREMEEKRNRKKEEILRRIVAFDWAEDVDPPPSTENEPIIPTRPISADPADTSTDTNTIVVPSAVPTAQMNHQPRDLSCLRSSTPNPWGSLRRRHCSRYSHAPRRFTCQRQHPPTYPVNTYLPTTPIPKPPAPTSIHIFETVRHPHGIGPLKPVIRAPARMTRDMPAHLAQHMDRAIVKAATPLPLSHSAATIQCQCGQFVPISDTLQLRFFPLHHTFGTFISHFISRPLSFPAQLFSRFMFS
jgi:hypothetical protein